MDRYKESKSKKPLIAMILSLVAGIWMVASSWFGFRVVDNPLSVPERRASSISWVYHEAVLAQVWTGYWWVWLGLLMGLAVIVGSIILYSKPRKHTMLGAVIIAASVINLFFGAGGLLASLLGIIGGVMAIAWKPLVVRP